MHNKQKITLLFSLLISISLDLQSMGQEAAMPIKGKSLIRENAQRLENISYLNSTEHVVALPNGQELGFDWGFKGSGSLLQPFTPIKINLKTNDNLAEQEFSPLGLLKVVAANKLKNKLNGSWNIWQQYLPDLNWLLDGQHTPMKVFALKLFLLIKDPTLKNQSFRKKVEVLRLLFKLSQSGALDSIDKDKKLSDYLPENLKTFIVQDSELIKFIDDVWSKIVNNLVNYESQLQESHSGIDKKFTFAETFKFMFITLLKGFNEYKIIKLKELENNNIGFDAAQKLSEDDKQLVQELRNQEERLVYTFNAARDRFNKLESDLDKLKLSGEQSEFDKDVFNFLNEDFQKVKADKDLYEKELLEIQSQINELEYGINIKERDVNATGSSLFNLLLNVLLKTPEFQEMAIDINGKNPAYNQVRDSLYSNLENIFKNSEHIKENLSIYRYIVKTLFPGLRSTFNDLSKEVENKENLNPQEVLFASLGL